MIHATPVMSAAESRRIYAEIRETSPAPEAAERLRQADAVFARAMARRACPHCGRQGAHTCQRRAA